MTDRRILSLWFPHLGADRLIRRNPLLGSVPLGVVQERNNMQVLSSLNSVALGYGLRVDQPVRDAHAMCEGLITRARSVQGEAGFLASVQRWAGKFSPWVAPEAEDGLVVDLTGCAHLFGGEEPLLEIVQQDCNDLGLAVRMGLADTRGAAWALARFAGQVAGSHRSGDAIDQEARATRSRAGKRRHWTRGGAAPVVTLGRDGSAHRIAAPGQMYSALGPLPIAALRLDAELTAQLARLGLRRISDLLGQPRAGLARRFGRGLVMRLDQAMGSAPEPVSPARPADHFAVRLTLPDPIGLEDDILAGLDRLLPQLCAGLERKGRGARRVRLQAFRSDHGIESIEVGLARPSHDPDRMRPLLALKLGEIDAGFGIDMLRLEVVQSEPIYTRSAVGHLEAGHAVNKRLAQNTALDDLIGRIGARVGLEAITRRHPASSHIPEKTSTVLAAAWSAPNSDDWPKPATPRPVLMWRPEPVGAPDTPQVPQVFRWRGQDLTRLRAIGPERIAPEWWLDDPDWRSGVRDYWVTDTADGQRLWLFYGHGGTMLSGWFCHGSYA
ncbi:DNA polymerase Y family protein [Roseobacter sp. YSTF-M11]|uniref:DNA polymerase Y family protein n=1 Tax=Roseobacter insulae TaxID=2859783 RepID=A0A9X1FS48_9RHOB|nr:DNA polymerase Y family protein [Roseobacter insulae]MBW4706612.1 DNA polymerase Y family protein [Roseobacter insulae]